MNYYDKIINKIAKNIKEHPVFESVVDTNNALIELKKAYRDLFQSFRSLLTPYLLSVSRDTLEEESDELDEKLQEFKNDFVNVARGMNSLYKATAKNSIQNSLGFSDFIDKNTADLVEMYSRIITRMPDSETRRKLTNAYFAFGMMIRAMDTEIKLYNYENEDNKLDLLRSVNQPESYNFEHFELKPYLDGVVSKINELLNF